MTPLYSNTRDLFSAVLELESDEERETLLAKVATQSPDLAAEVRELLQAHTDAKDGDFIITNPHWFDDKTEKAGGHLDDLMEEGSQIGRYKLLERIGEGGMGVVYMAEQEKPVRRRVALKIIKQGMDTKQVVARFEAERQALALMDHPNIASILDAGATKFGRPYFVMELVQGVPITEFCDKNKLAAEDRLNLFMPVCQAIHSAHQKGVIHRDIKPSNVLVTLHHGEPMPKVIDFGVSKATNQKLTEKTLFTRYAQMIGTPAYMSPEQAEMSSMDVDTRTDVYSLGALLYELLTGTTPISSERLNSLTYGEMQRVISEEEPPKPSTRLNTMEDETKGMIAKRLSIDLSRLNRKFKGDIDWIVMKCLEKDRRRRYETANELVADLKRHLNGEPVSAAAPSLVYQMQKLARRNKGTFLAAAAVVAAVVVGATVATWQAIRAHTLLENEQRLTSELQEAVSAADAARAEVDRRLYRSNLDRVRMSLRDNQPGFRGTTDSLLKEAADLNTDIRDNATMRNAAFAAILRRYSGKGEIVYRGPQFEIFQNAGIAWNTEIMAAPFEDGSIQVMDKATREVFDTLRSDSSRVRSLSIASDGKTLLSTHETPGGSARIWQRIPTGKWHLHREIPLREDRNKAEVAAGISGFVILSNDSSTLRYWKNFSDPKPEFQELPDRYKVGFFRHVVISPDEQWAAIKIIGTQKLLIWNLVEGKLRKEILLPHDGIVWMDVSPNGDYLGLGISDFFQTYETETFTLLVEKTGPGEGCEWFDFSSDEYQVVYGRRPAYLHHLPSNESMGRYATKPAERFVASEAFKFGINPGELIYEYPTGENEVTVERCLKGSTEFIELIGHRASKISFHPTESIAVTTSLDQRVRSWNLKNGQTLQKVSAPAQIAGEALFSPNHNLLALRLKDEKGSIEIRGSISLHPVGMIEHGEPTLSASFNATSSALHTLGKNSIKIWSRSSAHPAETASWELASEIRFDQITSNRTVPTTLEINGESQFSPDGRYLAWIEKHDFGRNFLRLLDLQQKTVLDKQKELTGSIDFGFMNDGTTIAVPNEQGAVEFWNFTTGKVESRTSKLDKYLGDIEISNDGRFLAFTFRPRRLGIYDLKRQTLVAVSPQLESGISQFCWSPDSSRLGVSKGNGFISVVDMNAVRTNFEELGIAW